MRHFWPIAGRWNWLFPVAEFIRKFPPGGARADNPEHGIDEQSVAATVRLLCPAANALYVGGARLRIHAD